MWQSIQSPPRGIDEVDYQRGNGEYKHQADLQASEISSWFEFYRWWRFVFYWNEIQSIKSRGKISDAGELWNIFLKYFLTRILPVPVWPEISSPAQSLAEDMKSEPCTVLVSVTGALPHLTFTSCPASCWRSRFSSSSCRLTSDWERSSSLLQSKAAPARMKRTEKTPTMNERTEERRKHHHFLSARQAETSWLSSDVTVLTIISGDWDEIQRWLSRILNAVENCKN